MFVYRIEEIQEAIGVPLDCGFTGVPIFCADHVGERVDLEVVFHVDG